jgi:hypothetical protein
MFSRGCWAEHAIAHVNLPAAVEELKKNLLLFAALNA